MTKYAGRRIRLIAHWEVETAPELITSTGGYEFLCSYSWKQTAPPTIYVPGTPPRWTPPTLPVQLNSDTGSYWCDQHGHRVPRHQFEPIFQSLAVMNPTARFQDVDIIINRNTLQKLYTFASFKRGKKPFHVDLDMVQNTLFISRREDKPKVMQSSGYGRAFEAAFTTEDPSLSDVEGHHRVIRYRFGGLNLVVRIEADGFYSDAEHHEDSPNEFFRNVQGTTTQTVIPHHSPRPTVALAQGTLVPHNTTLEMKSNHGKGAAMEQLWFGRTPYVSCAKHRKGLVNAADVVRLKQEDFEEWEVKNQRHLRRLEWFLGELRRATRETKSGAAVLVMIEKGAPVQVFERLGEWGALPGEVIGRFWD